MHLLQIYETNVNPHTEELMGRMTRLYRMQFAGGLHMEAV